MKKHIRGLHANRLKQNAHNPREVAFVEQWEREHEYGYLLVNLFRVPCHKEDPGAQRILGSGFGGNWANFPLGQPTERDRIVAATLIQWLGSSVGMSFLDEALKRVGGRVEWPEAKGN